jgi:hypothetical protein
MSQTRAQVYQRRIQVPLPMLFRPPLNIPDIVRSGGCGLRRGRLLTRFEAAYDICQQILDTQNER